MALPKTTILLLLLLALSAAEDYYEILGIGKDADNRQIRKAFKKLALKYHPDKSDEPDAQEKFLKINKAYETLKDEDKRKRYDRFGEEEEDGSGGGGGGGGGGAGRGYQSWSYYHDDFGLYDDDPEIVTMDYHDFRRSIGEGVGRTVWFVNFYSPQCGHCHELAPAWRRVARMLAGIVRIGAVNCQDDFHLCRQQNIMSYPSLILYSPEGNLRFQGPKEEEELIQFVVDNLPDQVIRLRTANFDQVVTQEERKDRPWVILFCKQDDFRCPGKQERHLLANLLHSLVNFGVMDCSANKKLCREMTGGRKKEAEADIDTGAFYFDSSKAVREKDGRRLVNSEFREVADEVLDLLPAVPVLDDEQYSKIRLKLEDDLGSPWLIRFVFGKDGISIEQKKLPGLLGGKVKFGLVDCSEHPEVCRELQVKRPAYVAFKLGGGHEFLFGRDSEAADVAAFALEAAEARGMRTLVAADFPEVVEDGAPVFVDFFAPWCPPCLNLLPEYRKASIKVGRSVTFGTVDCTTQKRICDQYNIRSYPTTVFFNQSKLHHYQGEHSVEGLTEFVQEVLRPSVVSLTYRDFQARLGAKGEDEMWLVDFYAPWCGPCMQLSPQWTRLAQLVKKIPEVKVAKVDCTQEEALCRQQVVRSYPTIRMFPLGSRGVSKYFVYTGFHRDAYSLRDWVYQSLPSFVENLTPYTFQQKVTGSSGRPALVYFYTPWCGHCQHFSPTFDDISLDLRDLILTAKINCERFQNLCAHESVRAYPTVRFYPGGNDGYGEEVPNRAPEYIVGFVHDRLERMARQTGIRHDEL